MLSPDERVQNGLTLLAHLASTGVLPNDWRITLQREAVHIDVSSYARDPIGRILDDSRGHRLSVDLFGGGLSEKAYRHGFCASSVAQRDSLNRAWRRALLRSE